MTTVQHQEVKKGLMVQLPLSLWMDLTQYCLIQSLSKKEFIEELVREHLVRHKELRNNK